MRQGTAAPVHPPAPNPPLHAAGQAVPLPPLTPAAARPAVTTQHPILIPNVNDASRISYVQYADDGKGLCGGGGGRAKHCPLVAHCYSTCSTWPHWFVLQHVLLLFAQSGSGLHIALLLPAQRNTCANLSAPPSSDTVPPPPSVAITTT
jgi:hypothetical protein